MALPARDVESPLWIRITVPNLRSEQQQPPLSYLYELDVCLLALEHVLAGEAGPVLVKVGQHLSLVQ